jgi:hypothetical protein
VLPDDSDVTHSADGFLQGIEAGFGVRTFHLDLERPAFLDGDGHEVQHGFPVERAAFIEKGDIAFELVGYLDEFSGIAKPEMHRYRHFPFHSIFHRKPPIPRLTDGSEGR